MAFYFLDYQYHFHFWGTDIGPVLVKNKIPIFCLNQVSSTLLRQSTENHVCFKKDTLSHLKGYLVFDRKRLEPRVLSDNDTKGVILILLWCTFLVPSLKNSSQMFQEIFLIRYFTILGKQFDVITSLICIIQKRQYL